MMYKIEKDFMVDEFRCVVVGQSLGHRCGYIGIPKEHPLYGVHEDSIDVYVHGGWTYSEDTGKLGYPVEGDLWWIGFDCAHYGDGKDFNLIKELADERTYYHMLKMEKMFPIEYEVVRTTEYVEEELRNAIEQIKAMG